MPSQQYLALAERVEAKDPAAAQAMFELAMCGDADALFKGSEMRLRGIGAEIDVKAAVELLESAAAKGHAEALRARAYFDALGIGSKADPAKARKMLEKIAAEDRFVAVQLAFLKHVQCRGRLATAKRQLLSSDPHVEIIQGLFSPEECRYVQMLAKP
jgi:hypothetical protein